MLAVTPSSICVRVSSRKSRGGGPALLFTRMSGSGQAANSAAWPSGVATSARTGVILAPVALPSSAAVVSSLAASSPLITTSQPACASACAQARPSPRLDAQTMALRPAIPRSMQVLLGRTSGVGTTDRPLSQVSPQLQSGLQNVGSACKNLRGGVVLVIYYLHKYPATEFHRLYHTCNSFSRGRGLIIPHSSVVL